MCVQPLTASRPQPQQRNKEVMDSGLCKASPGVGETKEEVAAGAESWGHCEEPAASVENHLAHFGQAENSGITERWGPWVRGATAACGVRKAHCILEGTANIPPCPCTPPLPPRPRSGPPDWRWPYAPSAGQRAFSSACNHPEPPSRECPGWSGRERSYPRQVAWWEGGRLASAQQFLKQHHPLEMRL